MADDIYRALPLTDLLIQGGADGQSVILGIENETSGCAVKLSHEQAAMIAVNILDLLAKASANAVETVQFPPLLAHDIRLDRGRSPASIVLAVDLGAATLQLEVQGSQLLAALEQTRFAPGEPPKPN